MCLRCTGARDRGPRGRRPRRGRAPRVVGDRPRRQVDRAYDVYPAWEHSRAGPARGDPRARPHAAGGVRGGRPWSASASVELPLLDNTHIAYVDVGVPPRPPRARGRSPRVLAGSRSWRRDAGRTHLIAAAFTPPGGTSAGRQVRRRARLRRGQHRGLQGPRPARPSRLDSAGRSGSPSGSTATASWGGRPTRPTSTSPTWPALSAAS